MCSYTRSGLLEDDIVGVDGDAMTRKAYLGLATGLQSLSKHEDALKRAHLGEVCADSNISNAIFPC